MKLIARLFSGLLVSLLFNSCNPTTLTYSLIYSADEPIGEISKTIEKVLEANYNVDIILSIGDGSVSNIDSVAEGKIDFTITENNTPFREGVNSVLVFYPQILHVFHSNTYEPQSFEELVYDKKIFMNTPSSGSFRFMVELFDFFNIDTSRVDITFNPFDNYDIIAGFNDIIPDNALSGLGNFKLYSFDDIDNYGKGSIVEGISLKFPKVKPYMIPSNTYGSLTKEPILTLAADAVLICRASMRDTPINDMIRTIFREKQEFEKISPLIYAGLDEGFDRSRLSFPLHNGARTYLDRDEPGFFERYAELVGVMFSIIVAIISALISLTRWQKQKKKDRVDVFYKVLMDIKNELPQIKTIRDGAFKIKEIQESQNKAFKMLINEELEADESFRIFMELSKETIDEVKMRVRSIKAKL
ncbi:MAG: TAXI family TRAP transporter solute-binding subunit [Cyclobacteriaceae bacterium]